MRSTPPFFQEIRSRQPFNHNLLMPCMLIDNPTMSREIMELSGAHPTHPGAESMFTELHDHLDQYSAEVTRVYTAHLGLHERGHGARAQSRSGARAGQVARRPRRRGRARTARPAPRHVRGRAPDVRRRNGLPAAVEREGACGGPRPSFCGLKRPCLPQEPLRPPPAPSRRLGDRTLPAACSAPEASSHSEPTRWWTIL